MAVEAMQIVGQGSTKKEAVLDFFYSGRDKNDCKIKFPKLNHYSPRGVGVNEGKVGNKIGTLSLASGMNDWLDKGFVELGYVSSRNDGTNIYIGMDDAFEDYRGDYKITMTVAVGPNALYFYDRKGKAIGIVIGTNGGTDWGYGYKISDYTDGGLKLDTTRTLGTFNGGTEINYIFEPNTPADGYVSMTPIYLRDNLVGRIGGNPETVYYQKGIDNSSWGPAGTTINGKLFYGFEEFCTPADAERAS